MKMKLSDHLDDAQFVHDHLYDYNLSKTGGVKQTILLDPKTHFHTFLVFASEEEAESQRMGGLVYHIDGITMHIDFVWISNLLRGKGAGALLMDAAQKKAVQTGCKKIKLFTNTFQAPGFYQKLGYALTSAETDPQMESNTIYHYELDLN